MRRRAKWTAVASCGNKKLGHSGLSAGMMIAARQGVNALFPGVDHEGIIGDPRNIAAVLKSETETVIMNNYCNVTLGLKGANVGMQLNRGKCELLHVCTDAHVHITDDTIIPRQRQLQLFRIHAKR